MLLRGLNHGLANRASSFGAIVMGASLRGLQPTDLERLSAEVAKLEELLRAYRLLDRSKSAPAEPTQVADAVSDALTLLAMHPVFHDVECTVAGDRGTSPVLVIPPTLTHAVVFMLCTAAARLAHGTTPRGLHVSYRSDPAWVTIAVESTTPVRGDMPAEVTELSTVRWLVLGASVAESASRTAAGGVRLEMRVPTLASARAHERAN
jgi:hypothetical protein